MIPYDPKYADLHGQNASAPTVPKKKSKGSHIWVSVPVTGHMTGRVAQRDATHHFVPKNAMC